MLKKIYGFSMAVFLVSVLLFPSWNMAHAQAVTSDPNSFQTLAPGGASAFANAGDFQPLTNVKGTPFERMFGTGATLTGLFQNLFNISITIGALLAVLMLAWSGYQYLFSDVVKMKTDAKQRIQNALLGLLMLLATVLILRQINPDIVSLRILNNQGAAAASGQQQTAPSNATDSGTQMTSPVGYCINQGAMNMAQTSASYYKCYSTLPACGQMNGISNCTAYSTSQDTTYSSGTGNGLGVPISYSDYMAYQWCPVGAAASCNRGVGWSAVSADYCGAGASVGTGTCYALQKPVSYSDVAQVPTGNWCYAPATVSNGAQSITYSCSSSQTICESERASTIAASGPTGLCAQKTAAGTALAVAPVSYTNYQYAAPLKVDTAGGVPGNACSTMFGKGYVEVALSACPATATMGATVGKCCALPAQNTPAPTTISDQKYTDTASLSTAPVGSFCYEVTTGGDIYCSTGQSLCSSNLTKRVGTTNVAFGCQAVN